MSLAAASMFLQAAFAASPAAPPREVTCFNGGERGKPVGVWHWEGVKSWKRARDDFAPMFTLVFEPGRETYDRADLPYCMYVSDVVAAKTVKCASGTLEISKLEVGRTLAGRYAFELADGSKVEASFEAGYCEPAWPIR